MWAVQTLTLILLVFFSHAFTLNAPYRIKLRPTSSSKGSLSSTTEEPRTSALAPIFVPSTYTHTISGGYTDWTSRNTTSDSRKIVDPHNAQAIRLRHILLSSDEGKKAL